MTSKELLDHLTELKIPAKNHASTLVEAYVDRVRKALGPEIAERQAEIEVERQRAAEEEAKRLAAEEEARAAEEAARQAAEEEAARAAEEEARVHAEEEKRRREEAEADRKRKEDEKAAERERAEEDRKRREEEQAKEAEERERYRKMAQDAEEATQRARATIVEQAARAAADTGGRKSKKSKKAAKHEEEVVESIETGPEPLVDGILTIEEGSTIKQFADAIGVPPNDVVKKLLMMGEMLTVNQPLGGAMLEKLGEAYELLVDVREPGVEAVEEIVDDPADLEPRPPVVTVMGHVDHGKTSLLDAIRSTGVAASEAGGITQHIGASVVHKNGRQITFIDTPGHEAFTAMRARGANMTDIAVLVVAADDGVMPQTVEAIDHAKAADVPIIVAVNKIDKDGANPDLVRKELADRGVAPEDWGGNNIFVDVSAKKLIGIEDLLEMILLVADVQELKANPYADARGVVVEAKLDKGRGPVATVLVQRGTLHVGDALVAGTAFGRVRALHDAKGKTVHDAKPADPVEVLGLSSVPSAGDDFKIVADDRTARGIAEERDLKRRLVAQEAAPTHVSLDDLFARIQEGQAEVKLIIKADVQGSIEALKDALEKMDQSEVRINVIHSAVGAITETDVTFADASDAIVIGFNVRPEPKAKVLAERTKVDMRLYRVIYKIIEDINAARVGMLKPTIEEQDSAVVEVRELFKVPKIGTIAGCYVQEGEVSRNDQVRVVREGAIVFDGKIGSLRRFKDDASSVKSGYECGLSVEDFQDLKEGDIIEAYRTVEVAREE